MSLTLLPFTALIALVPAAIVPFRRSAERDTVFWLVWAVATAGTAVWVFVRQSTGWGTGPSTALLLTTLTCLILYGCICLLNRDASRLSPLLMPYLLALGLLATIWSQVPEKSMASSVPLAWISTHILVSVTTYGLITLAAVAALAATLQHRALRSKKRTRLSIILPAVSSSERILVQLLVSGEIVLALGLVTGMATLYFSSGQIIIFDHKSALALAVFVVLAVLLLVHFKSGVRGRAATQLVLLAYLLLTLGYPGVKFVTDIILGPA